MADVVHIIRVQDTWANAKANLDEGQTILLTDEDNEHVHLYDGDYYFPAISKDWDGAAWNYHDSVFNDVTCLQDSIVARYISHYGDSDTRIFFQTDQITITAGNVDFIDIVESAQDYIEFNSGEADIDFIINTTITDTIFSRGSDGFTGIWTNAPDSVLHIQKSEGTSPTVDSDTVLIVENSTGSVNSYISIVGCTGENETGVLFGVDSGDDKEARIVYNATDDKLQFYHDSTMIFTIDGVALNMEKYISWIGITAPGTPGAGYIRVYHKTGTKQMYYKNEDGNEYLMASQWSLNGVKLYYSLGNVGIGLSDPDAQLHISDGGSEPTWTDSPQLIIQATSATSDKAILNIVGGASTGRAGIYMGDTNDNDRSAFYWDPALSATVLWTNAEDQDTILFKRSYPLSPYMTFTSAERGGVGLDNYGSNNKIYLVRNGICDGSGGWDYAISDYATKIELEDDIRFDCASSGTSGNPITFNTRVTFLNDGGVKMPNLKSGSTQPVGVVAGELWVDTDDQTVKMGT